MIARRIKRITFIMTVLKKSTFQYIKNTILSVLILFACHTSSFKTIPRAIKSALFDRNMITHAVGGYPDQGNIEAIARSAVLSAGKIIRYERGLGLDSYDSCYSYVPMPCETKSSTSRF